MAFCPNCGNQVTGRFCPNCGTDVGTAASAGATGAAGATAGSSWSAPPPPPPTAASGLSENVASALCYALGFVTGIIFLFLSPYNTNRTVRFHAWQSIFFNIAVVVIDWVLRIVIWSVLHLVFVGWGLLSLVHIFWFVIWLLLIFNAYNRKMMKLPVVGDLAARQA